MSNLEIERKFLVSPSLNLKNLTILQHKRIMQAYWFLEDVTSDKKYKNKNLAKTSNQTYKIREKTLN